MELYQLKSFIAVANEGNLTRAAERLFTSQPAVSAHIKALEEELGVTLFDRTARGMNLTLDGEKLAEKAEAILAGAKELNDLARALQASPSGSLRVGVISDGDDLRLDAISATLYAAFPDIQLEFAHSSTGVITKGLLNGDLDVGFAEGVIESPKLSGFRVGQTRVVVVGAPKYQQAFASPDWHALEQLPWVFKTPDCSYHQLMTRISQAHELNLNKQYVIDHEATCLQFVRNGVAISVVNEAAVSDAIALGELVAWEPFREVLDVQLLCLGKRRQERAIQAFFQAAQQVFDIEQTAPRNGR